MTNRFKGLDLIDRVPEELWKEVHDVVQEAKWLSEEALQTAEKIRDSKCKGEKERYTNLNAELQRIAKKDKKAFLSDQCKEIEDNNRMGKTRDLLKKIKRYQGNISHKNGHHQGRK